METNLHVEQYGKGRTVLFIHGSGSTSEVWQRQKVYLKSMSKVVLPDLPGHGKSPGDGYDNVEKLAHVVYRAMDRMNTGRYYVAGHSLGGAIAMSLALSHPERVRGVILIGTGARLRVLPRILENIVHDKERTVAEINDLCFSRQADGATKEKARAIVSGCRSEIIFKDFSACDRFDIVNSVGSMRTPALIICGTEDVLTPVKYSRFLAEKIPGSQLVCIEGAGHMVMMEKPDEVNNAIEGFVNDGR